MRLESAYARATFSEVLAMVGLAGSSFLFAPYRAWTKGHSFVPSRFYVAPFGEM